MRAVQGFPVPLSAIEPCASSDDVLTAFLGSLSRYTLLAYGQDLENFRRFLGVESVSVSIRLLLSRGNGPANLLVFSYRSSMVQGGIASATVNRRLCALRSVVKCARMVGFVSWALDVPSVRREGYKDTRGPGHDAVCRIIEVAAAGPSVKALRDVAMLRLLYDLALRCGEVVSLDVSHVDIPGRRLSILGKGRQDREYLTLPVSTAAALSAWLEVRGSESGPLFLSSGRGRSLRWSGRMDTRNLYGLVRRLGESVGVRTWPHGLRHTAITEVIKMAQQNGVGLDECCQYSRHKDVKTLMIYRDKERDVQGTLASFLSERVQLDVVP